MFLILFIVKPFKMETDKEFNLQTYFNLVLKFYCFYTLSMISCIWFFILYKPDNLFWCLKKQKAWFFMKIWSKTIVIHFLSLNSQYTYKNTVICPILRVFLWDYNFYLL